MKNTIGTGTNTPNITFASYVISYPNEIVLNTEDESVYVGNMSIKEFCRFKSANEQIILDEKPAP